MNSEKVMFDGMSAHGATATYSVFADVRLSGDGKACPTADIRRKRDWPTVCLLAGRAKLIPTADIGHIAVG